MTCVDEENDLMYAEKENKLFKLFKFLLICIESFNVKVAGELTFDEREDNK